MLYFLSRAARPAFGAEPDDAALERAQIGRLGTSQFAAIAEGTAGVAVKTNGPDIWRPARLRYVNFSRQLPATAPATETIVAAMPVTARPAPMGLHHRVARGGGFADGYAVGRRSRSRLRPDEADACGNDRRKNDCTHPVMRPFISCSYGQLAIRKYHGQETDSPRQGPG